MANEFVPIEEWLKDRPVDNPVQGRFAQGETVGEWRIEAYLGKGCSAEVYRVVNVRTGREGALKLLVSEDPRIRERFVVEKDTIRFLQSGAFPTFYDGGDHYGQSYYVMEYLQPFLFPLPRKDIPRFMVLVAKAVQRLHTAGYVHRDLKPSNILRRRDGKPVLIDPGLVKKMDVRDAKTRPSSLTLINGRPLVVGTLGFAAPEQLLKGEASARSDVFSLGKVLAACFEKKPKGCWLAIIRRATQESPDDRYESADAFAQAIRRRHLPFILKTLALLVLAGTAVTVVAKWPSKEPIQVAQPTVEVVVAPSPDPESLLKLPDETEDAHLQRLLPLAEKDNVAAQLLVAEAYFYGRGTETNRFTAVEWYRRAAEAGNSDAEASLGLCYLYGYGCDRNDDIAVECFIKAAEMGNVVAMTNLAYCYLNGRGVETNDEIGVSWAQDAAVHGHAPGQTLLAECLLCGKGVKQDRATARTWLQAAARQDNKRAKMLLESLDSDGLTPQSDSSPSSSAPSP